MGAVAVRGRPRRVRRRGARSGRGRCGRTPGVLAAVHATPFGELPGSVVINFPTIDALCHAWDLSASLGRPLEFPAEWIPAVTAVVDGDLHRRRPRASA